MAYGLLKKFDIQANKLFQKPIYMLEFIDKTYSAEHCRKTTIVG